MIAFSPPVFPTFGCPLEDPIGYDQISYFSRVTQRSAFLPSYEHQDLLLEVDHQSTSFTAYNNDTGDPSMVKKLNHNASERDRRKKMNSLYSSLRSLLPASDEMKKLSIPATISKVLKYIPELQQQMKRLVQRKEELLLKISKQDHVNTVPQINQRKSTARSALLVVSANQLSDKEVIINMSTYSNAMHASPLSEILLLLEEEGLILINSFAFECSGGRVFYNLHLQAGGTHTLECDTLSEKLSSFYEKREAVFP